MRVSMKTAALAISAGVWAYRSMRRRPENLQGKTAFITGGSRGLGLALACELAEQGCRVALVARDADRLKEAANHPRLRNTEVQLLSCDVRDAEQVKVSVDAAVRRFGRIDILINNAGVIQVGPAVGMTVEDYREAADVMYFGAVHTIMAAMPHLRRQGAGSIVNVASIGGKVAVPHLTPYSAAKFALVGLSEGLTAELHREKIHVMTVIPGLMRTGSHLNAKFRGEQGREFAWFGLSANAPALSISPSEAARSIVEGIRMRRRELVLSRPARALSRAKVLIPGAVALGLKGANRFLPASSGEPTKKMEGRAVVRRKPSLAVRAVERMGRGAVARYQ